MAPFLRRKQRSSRTSSRRQLLNEGGVKHSTTGRIVMTGSCDLERIYRERRDAILTPIAQKLEAPDAVYDGMMILA